ncbi:unnamed protein product [Dicrocoelium dendriticum]|nr:unnamed protein product [Dicrocoelium dendriticum]
MAEGILDANNAFLLGNYRSAIKILQKCELNAADVKQKGDVLLHRVYIAQGRCGIVLDELRDVPDSLELQLVRLVALYFNSTDERPKVLEELEKLLNVPPSSEDETALILAATVYLDAGLIDRALQILHQGDGVNCNALRVQAYMALHRYDLAGKVIRRMQAADEDSLPCQLATALYNISKGGDRLQEALNIYEELKEKYGSTPVILNGQAAAFIGMNRWEDAESVLQESLDLDSSNSDSIVNMIVVSHHLGKPVETINRLTSQLKESNKTHPFLTDLAEKDAEFSRCSQHYAPSIPC